MFAKETYLQLLNIFLQLSKWCQLGLCKLQSFCAAMEIKPMFVQLKDMSEIYI